MKKLLITLLLLTGVVLALPSVQQVQNAMTSNNLPLAEQLVNEVLTEKPNSALAHYEMAQIKYHENQYSASLKELNTAQSLDSSLSFTNNHEYFYMLQNRDKAMISNKHKEAGQSVTTTTNADNDDGFVWLIIGLILVGVIGILYLIFRRKQPADIYSDSGCNYKSSSRGYTRLESNKLSDEEWIEHCKKYNNRSGTGMHNGTGTAIASGLGGLAAGIFIGEILEDNHTMNPSYDNSSSNRNSDSGNNDLSWDTSNTTSSWDNSSPSSDSSPSYDNSSSFDSGGSDSGSW